MITSRLLRGLLLVVLMSASAWCVAQPAGRPNVVVILSDDQGWGDFSMNGNANLQTPNVDSLARDGASFDWFYVCSVCAPTRAEFLTGRYHSRSGVRGVSTGQERMNTDEQTIAHVFRGAGYATGMFGKWHNGSQWPYHPRARGFDEYYGFTSGHWGEYFDPPLDWNGKMVRGKGYIADDLTDHAMGFIEQNSSRPFFCYLAFNTPHSPFAVPEEDWLRLKDKPLTMRSENPRQEDLDQTRCVLAMCENQDRNIGRVLKKLDELQIARNTIVLFFCDNGPATWRWNGGMKGRKGSIDEGGLRSPLLMRWPGKIPARTRVGQVAGAIDLLPTLAGLTGVKFEAPRPLDGMDLSPAVMGRSKEIRDRMIFIEQGARVGVRTQQYRMDATGALFDISVDPGQKKNIAQERPEVTERLSKAVAEWRKEAVGPRADDRPFPVGYREFPTTLLPARDGVAHGTVRRSASAPNSSYFVNWTSASDSMTWDVEVNTAGTYDVVIWYTCPEQDAGSTIELSFKGSAVKGKVTPGWDPPLYTNQDTIPRPAGESRMKEFRPLEVGKIRLEKGRGILTLRGVEIPGRSVMDVRQLVLTLVAEQE